MDFTSFENADFNLEAEEPAKKERAKLLPNKEVSWPFEIRILPNPSKDEPQKIYHRTDVHWLQIGSMWFNVPCRRVLNDRCPFCEEAWNARDMFDALVTEGAKSENHPKHREYKMNMLRHRMYKVGKTFSFLAARKDDDNIYIFNSKTLLTRAIFGDRRTGVLGALKDIQEYSVPVFDPTKPTGWVKVNKKGKGLDTIYTAEAMEVTVVQNKSKVNELYEQDLSPAIKELYSSEDNFDKIPKITKLFRENAWSLEEMTAFVESDGANLPKWVSDVISKSGGSQDIKKHQDTSSDFSIPGMSESNQSDSSDDLEDVPF